ncbi:MAG: helix-turn-helix domain-containing protein [Patescibacteria group bacterium]|nr:helix-turn-helix domain-containing protein [Patescibacteria group bacterium]MDD5726856.1 helix-turn-helix domain-containing protein [Patescibacteria group bacterium]
MLLEQLESLGLNKREAQTYIAALELGPASILEISRKTKQNRALLYQTIEELRAKKLMVVTTQGKRKLFAAEPPVVLKGMLKDKLAILDAILPSLVGLDRKGNIKPVLKFYEGLEGIKDVYRPSACTKDKRIVSFIGVEQLNSANRALLNFWETEYAPLRKRNGVFADVIVPDTPEGLEFKKKDEMFYRKTKLVPASNYNFENEIMVYEDLTLIFVYSLKEQFAISIQSPAIANTLRMIWKIAWNSAY